MVKNFKAFKQLDEEMGNPYKSTKLVQIVAFVITIVGIICSLTGIGLVVGIPLILCSVPLFIVGQINDDIRKTRVILKYQFQLQNFYLKRVEELLNDQCIYLHNVETLLAESEIYDNYEINNKETTTINQ